MPRDRRGFAHIAIILVVLALIGGVGWYFTKNMRTAPSPVAVQPELQEKPAADSDSLGDEVYAGVQSPIGDNLPETVSSVGNPVSELYKNPFD